MNCHFSFSIFQKRLQPRGFTLIELLVSITIIGILASLTFASFSSSQKRGRDGQRKFDLRNLQSALEQYYSQASPQSYPAGTDMSPLVTQNLIKGALPTDPSTSVGYYYQAINATNGSTCAAAPCTSYYLCAKLENTSDPDLSKVATQCKISGKPASSGYYGVQAP